jgi:hypothetical protein
MKNVTRLLSATALAFMLVAFMLPFSTTVSLAAPCSACGLIKGAPGPIAGAGLPILAVGYGFYSLIRRRRKAV